MLHQVPWYRNCSAIRFTKVNNFFLYFSIMAKVKYSALVSDMRNKLNGSVLSKNRAGNYIRNKVTPVNPQTAAQQANRQQLGSMSSAWNGLTESQRQSWRGAVASFPYTDIFGDRKELDGKSLMIKLNLNLLNAGQAQIQTAPASVAIPELAITSAAAEVGGILQMVVTPATIPAGFSLLVYATPPVNAGVYFVKNKYRLLGAATAAAGIVDLASLYEAKFGALSTGDIGKAVSFRGALVSNTTGQLGVPVDIRIEVEAG